MKTLIIGLVSLPLTLFAANWYVRPAATGANSGTDWNNAWSNSSIKWASVKAGDTVWLAGGSYSGGLTVGASGSSGNPITINRVLSTDSAPKAAVGWSTSFDSTVAFSRAINLPACSYVTIDGRKPYVATVGAKGVTNAGITVTMTKSGGDGIDGATSGSLTGDIVRNVSLIGPYATTSSPASGTVSGINVCNSAHAVTNCVFHGISIVGTGEAVRAAAWNGVVIEYCYIADTNDDGQQHEDVQYSYPSTNCIWRYNQINNSPNDGVFFEYGGATNFSFYGNVYYNSQNWLIVTKAASGSVYGPMYIYNNVFMCPSANDSAWVSTNGAAMTGASAVYNNIFFNVSNNFTGSGVTSDYNAYNYTTLKGAGWPSREAHSFTFVGNPFVSLPSNTEPVGTIGNFHLTAVIQALFLRGKALSADGFINKDSDGNTRGAKGTWYIGSDEYSTASPTPTPSPTATPEPSATPKPTPTPTPPASGSKASLFSATAVPANQNLNDAGLQLQLGVKFQTSKAGKVTAIRFYKPSSDVGPHVVTLWTSGGTLLASTTSTSETASGWQQVNLPSPVTLSTGTTYIAAYHTSKYYSVNVNYFTNAVTSGPLTAPNSFNGLYIYASASTFPNNSYQASNYWVDVVFSY
jgi:hypothetical protein